jgi:hypothetical protein
MLEDLDFTLPTFCGLATHPAAATKEFFMKDSGSCGYHGGHASFSD